MSDVNEFLKIEADGEYAPEKNISIHSDGWLLISGRRFSGTLSFSPSQVADLISFLQDFKAIMEVKKR